MATAAFPELELVPFEDEPQAASRAPTVRRARSADACRTTHLGYGPHMFLRRLVPWLLVFELLRAGRDFTPLDREGQPLVALVNEEMVREFLPHENPIGVRIRWAGDTGPPPWMTVEGQLATARCQG